METVFQTARDKMGKSISSLKGEYAAIRANRATAAVLDKITVDYYGTATPINQLAAISVVEARILCIQPWDASTLHPIEKAIQTSDLGINPQNDGRVIRLAFPQLTEERRKELVKQIRNEAETARISLRNARRDAVEAFKKAQKEGMPEDESKDGEAQAQKLLEKFTKTLDEALQKKEKEIMTV